MLRFAKHFKPLSLSAECGVIIAHSWHPKDLGDKWKITT